MSKQLEIGVNYADIFGLDTGKDKMIYLGGIKFEMYGSKTGQGVTQDNQGVYDKINEYINRPTIMMGKPN